MGFPMLQHATNRRRTGLHDGAQRLLLKRGKPHGDVGRSRVAADQIYPGRLGPLHAPVDGLPQTLGDGGRCRPLFQKMFRPEPFHRLAAHDTTAAGDNGIGDTAHERIGRNPGTGIGATAFDADAQVRQGGGTC